MTHLPLLTHTVPDLTYCYVPKVAQLSLSEPSEETWFLPSESSRRQPKVPPANLGASESKMIAVEKTIILPTKAVFSYTSEEITAVIETANIKQEP
jgi:hypothetical protein